MQAKEILKELIKYDTFKDRENLEIMKYIQGILEEKGFKLDYRSKCLIMSIKKNAKLVLLDTLIRYKVETIGNTILWN